MNCIVVGGGVAGLLTALRLGLAGLSVIVIEADRLGSGATGANHGMLHSGALYVGRHDHVVSNCREAQEPFDMLLADAELPSSGAVYVVPERSSRSFYAGLDHFRIEHEILRPSDVPEVRPSEGGSDVMVRIRERVFSSRRIIEILAGQCLAVGVQILTSTAVRGLVQSSGRVEGVKVGLNERLDADHVVLAAGLGTPELLKTVASEHVHQFKSRLDMMVHYPDAALRRGLVFAELHRPVVMPALGGGALVSLFGGIQPQISGRRSFAVDLGKAASLHAQLCSSLAPRVIDEGGAAGYVVGKTDYVGSFGSEDGLVNPGFHVIDHASEYLSGLHTVVTGKMTLAFHASRVVAENVLRRQLELGIRPIAGMTVPSDLRAMEPWADPNLL